MGWTLLSVTLDLVLIRAERPLLDRGGKIHLNTPEGAAPQALT
jgi:hypothetical protein